MANLKTKYLGLELKNPVIAGSSGKTNSISDIRALAKRGVGAIVLKSLFEEQIRLYTNKEIESHETNYYPEAEDYVRNFSEQKIVGDYLKLIKEAKESVDVPIIASINCTSAEQWPSFARKIQEAGADALELNVHVLPTNKDILSGDYEKIYFDIVEAVKKEISIPLSLKIGIYFSSLANFIVKLSWSGIDGLVMFNRFNSPDINIEDLRIVAASPFSTPDEISESLRWIAMLSNEIKCSISATTGIKNSEDVIKQLLVGADTVQIASAIYKDGFDVIPAIITGLEKWMDDMEYNDLDELRGKMNFSNAENPSSFQRVQFMKYYSGIE